MPPTTQTGSTSKAQLWIGWILSILPVLFLLFDSFIHIMKYDFVIESFKMLGYNPDVALTLGIVELVCVILYIIPRTSVLGAILLTGFLGGAVATHVRIGDPLFSHILFPVYVALFLWVGLYMRDERLRTLVPFRK